jgi:hypothetical protein
MGAQTRRGEGRSDYVGKGPLGQRLGACGFPAEKKPTTGACPA